MCKERGEGVVQSRNSNGSAGPEHEEKMGREVGIQAWGLSVRLGSWGSGMEGGQVGRGEVAVQ